MSFEIRLYLTRIRKGISSTFEIPKLSILSAMEKQSSFRDAGRRDKEIKERDRKIPLIYVSFPLGYETKETADILNLYSPGLSAMTNNHSSLIGEGEIRKKGRETDKFLSIFSLSHDHT